MGCLRVLLVDDEPTILRAYKRALAGHDVAMAADGLEALATIRGRSDFDLILCDITMPEMNGVQLYEQVRRECPWLAEKFVFATAGSTQGHVDQFLATVTNHVLEKPFEIRALRDLVEALQSR
jgi:CheY-like chemotaxis protein